MTFTRCDAIVLSSESGERFAVPARKPSADANGIVGLQAIDRSWVRVETHLSRRCLACGVSIADHVDSHAAVRFAGSVASTWQRHQQQMMGRRTCLSHIDHALALADESGVLAWTVALLVAPGIEGQRRTDAYDRIETDDEEGS